MARQEIQVTFDPSSKTFTFSPERAILNEETATVDLSLRTVGQDGPEAKFAEPHGIRWMSDGPKDLEEIANPARTVLTFRGLPRNETRVEIDYGYVVSVDYEGETITSPSSQYPAMIKIPTGGGG